MLGKNLVTTYFQKLLKYPRIFFLILELILLQRSFMT